METKSTVKEVERAGHAFELQAERCDDGKWRFSVRRLSHDYHIHEHGPAEYRTVIVQEPEPGKMLRGPTDEERLADGLEQADNWVLENLHRWIR